MAKGTLLSIVFLIVGAELLPEPCEALSFELPLRLPRSPEPKCPGCSSKHSSSSSSDCNSNRNSHVPKVIILQEPYMLPPHPYPYHPAPYHPPLAMSGSYESPSSSLAPHRHPAPSSYEVPSSSASCEASVSSYELPSSASSYEELHPSPSYESQPPPPVSSYKPLSSPSISSSYESHPPVPSYKPSTSSSYESHSLPTLSYSPPMPSYISSHPSKPSYNPHPSPQLSYKSIKSMPSYSPPPMPYLPPPPAMHYESPAPASYAPASVPEIESQSYSPSVEHSRYSTNEHFRYSAPLESSGYDHSLSSPVEQSLYSQPSSQAPCSACYSTSQSYSPASQSSYSGCKSSYQSEEYHPVYASKGPAAEVNLNNYPNENDQDDSVVYHKYKKRSDSSVPKINHQLQRDRTPIIHRNFRPYERERRSGNYNWGNEGREKLYVVYRSDAGDVDMSNQNNNDQEDDSEAQSAIRRSLEIAKQQREQENALARHTQQQQLLHRYHYDQTHPNKPYSWQPDFKPLVQPSSSSSPLPPPSPPPPPQSPSQSPSQPPLPPSLPTSPLLPQEPIQPIVQPVSQRIEIASSEEVPDARILEMGNVEFDENDGDEVEDPVWQSNEWTSVPSLPYGDLVQQPEIVYDRGVPAILPAVTVSTSIDREDGKVNVGDIARVQEVGSDVKEIKTENPEKAVVIEDMGMPMTFTEPTSFENPILSTTDVA